MSKAPLLYPSEIESDTEQRFREALERKLIDVMSLIDATIELRTLPPQGKRLRAISRRNLIECGQSAMQALNVKNYESQAKEDDEHGTR